MGLKVERHPISSETQRLVHSRYERITRAVNNTFWNSDNGIENSFYVGSYGRGTAIETSDVDILMELPPQEYEHFTYQAGNGQSRLLQSVKGAILGTYPNSDVKGDGQVVVVNFSDGIRFEILPSFRKTFYDGLDGTYKYPDSHMGGNWLSTNPKAEIDAMKQRDRALESNGLLTATCQHIRYIRDERYSSYHLSGILIDSFVYQVIGDWHFLREGEKSSTGAITYEQHLLQRYNAISIGGLVAPMINAPGSNMAVESSKEWSVLGKILNYIV